MVSLEFVTPFVDQYVSSDQPLYLRAKASPGFSGAGGTMAPFRALGGEYTLTANASRFSFPPGTPTQLAHQFIVVSRLAHCALI